MILITGGSGFVGSHVVAALIRNPAAGRLRVLDAEPTRNPAAPDVELVRGSITDPAIVRHAVRGADAVIHLAAKVDPRSTDVAELQKINVEGTRTVLTAAVQAGCPLFLHLSSAGVYGHPKGAHPFRESDQPAPATPYQQSKWEAEKTILSAELRSTMVNVLRPTGIYGPGSRLEIPAYRRVARQKWALELSGGLIVHPTHVSDVTAAICAMLGRPAPNRTVLNLGGERSLRLEEFHEIVAGILKVRRRRLRIPSPISAPPAYLAARLLSLAGKPEPRLLRLSRGAILNAAVDDTVLRERYPDLRVVELGRGVQEHIAWARHEGLI